MPKCAACGEQYGDEYDGCPRCAKVGAVSSAGKGLSDLGCAMMLVPLAIIGMLLACSILR